MNQMIRSAMKYRAMAKSAASFASCAAAVALILGICAWAMIAAGNRGWAAITIFFSLLALAAALSWARECARCGRIADQLSADIGRSYRSARD